MSHQQGLEAARVSRRARAEKIARPTTSTRPALGAGGDAASHDGQEGEAAEGDEEQERPVDVGEEAALTSMPMAVPPWKAAHMRPT